MSPERRFIRILHLPFTPFIQQTLKLKNWTLLFFFFLASWLHKTLVPLLMRPFLNHQVVVSFCPIHKLSYCPSFSHSLWTSRQSSCICVFTRHAMIQGLCYWFPHWVTSFVVFLLYFKELYCERLDEHCLIWERAVWVDREYEYLRSLTFPYNKVTWGTFGFSVAWISYWMIKMIHFLWRAASGKKKKKKKKDCSE